MIAIIGSHIKNSTKTKLLQNDMVGQQHARITLMLKYNNTLEISQKLKLVISGLTSTTTGLCLRFLCFLR